MKIVLIIYAASWLILIAYYVYWYRKGNMDLPWETDEPWFLYAFLAALAPLLILTIPHSAWKMHVQKNKERIREMELEREKKEREQEISCALESFGKAALTSNLLLRA